MTFNLNQTNESKTQHTDKISRRKQFFLATDLLSKFIKYVFQINVVTQDWTEPKEMPGQGRNMEPSFWSNLSLSSDSQWNIHENHRSCSCDSHWNIRENHWSLPSDSHSIRHEKHWMNIRPQLTNLVMQSEAFMGESCVSMGEPLH